MSQQGLSRGALSSGLGCMLWAQGMSLCWKSLVFWRSHLLVVHQGPLFLDVLLSQVDGWKDRDIVHRSHQGLNPMALPWDPVPRLDF